MPTLRSVNISSPSTSSGTAFPNSSCVWAPPKSSSSCMLFVTYPPTPSLAGKGSYFNRGLRPRAPISGGLPSPRGFAPAPPFQEDCLLFGASPRAPIFRGLPSLRGFAPAPPFQGTALSSGLRPRAPVSGDCLLFGASPRAPIFRGLPSLRGFAPAPPFQG